MPQITNITIYLYIYLQGCTYGKIYSVDKTYMQNSAFQFRWSFATKSPGRFYLVILNHFKFMWIPIYIKGFVYVCSFHCLQDQEVSSTVWKQILKLLLHFLDSSFLFVMQGCYFLDKIAPLLENTILWHMDSQNKTHFLLSGLSPEHALSRKLKIVEFL